MRCLVSSVGWLIPVLVLGCSGPSFQSSTFSLHKPRRFDKAVQIGSVDGKQVIDLVFAMKRRPGTDVHAFIKAQQSGVERFVSPPEFADRFAVSSDDYQRVVDWLNAHDIQVLRSEPGRTTITAQATIDAVEAAFQPDMRMFEDPLGTFRSPTREPQLPAELAGSVASMAGLDNAALFHTHHLPPQPVPDATPGTPADIQGLYGANDPTATAFQGDGETIAILGTGYAPALTTDVDSFTKKYMLAFDRKSQYTQVFLGGPNRDDANLANTEYGENVLDVDMVMGMAPKATIVHIITATNGALFESGFSYIANYVPQAHAATISYGLCERYYAPYVTPFDFVFEQAAAEGQQWFTSGGDFGADDCGDEVPMAILSVEYPASSPMVFGVGGTQEATGGTEVVWNGHSDKDIGGGGQSEIYSKPDYQIGVGPFPDDGVRDVPDISALANGNILVIQGQAEASGGTSAASPIWAAVWARIDQSQGGTGILNGHDKLYKLGKAGVGFHDITKGDNAWTFPGYGALPGFDLATGWGTPNLPALIANWNI